MMPHVSHRRPARRLPFGLLLFVIGFGGAARPARLAAQQGARVEVGAGVGRSSMSAPTPGAAAAYGVSGTAAVHWYYFPRVLLGAEAAGWERSNPVGRSWAGFALASTRLVMPRPTGLSVMVGVGYARAEYAAFQRDTAYPGHVSRVALGGGLGYELTPDAPLHLGFYARVYNTLGGATNTPTGVERVLKIGPAGFHGGSVLLQTGVSLAWR